MKALPRSTSVTVAASSPASAGIRPRQTAGQVTALQNDLDHIDRAASILPMRHSDLFFSLLMRIDMTRTRLAARLATLQRLDPAA